MAAEDGAPVSPHGASGCIPTQMVYDDIKVFVNVKTKKDGLVTRQLLQGVSGIVQPGRLSAVMGASGAGKTTLLNVLAGYHTTGTKLSGSIKINGEAVTADKIRQLSGYVHQEDVILDTMTVREALCFAAHLRLPGSVPSQQRIQRALDVAEMLNLTKTLDNLVGSALIKGISGGEKRRLSLGMEMITNPSILFLDEPTSGLDTYTAHKVMRILSTLAREHGRTVLATIHQPSSDIFHLFDDMTVLSEGQTLYQGSAKASVGYFAQLGYVCPTYTNPADYLFMNILNVQQPNAQQLTSPDSESDLAEVQERKAKEEERVRGLLVAWKEGKENAQLQSDMQSKVIHTGIGQAATRSMAPALTQFVLLGQRAIRNSMRNKLILPAKIAQTVVLSLIVGLIYLNIGKDLKSVQDRQGSLFFIMVQCFFGTLFGVVTIFGNEKTVFLREYSTRMYNLPCYFFSRWIVELPYTIVLPFCSASAVYWMVGYQAVVRKFLTLALLFILLDLCGVNLGIFVACLSNNVEVTVAVLPMFTLPLLIFSGFIANSANIPVFLGWIKYISPMFYAYIAAIKNEFGGLKLHCKKDEKCPANYVGEDVIRVMGLEDQRSVEANVAIVAGIALGFLLLAYLALWINVRKMMRK